MREIILTESAWRCFVIKYMMNTNQLGNSQIGSLLARRQLLLTLPPWVVDPHWFNADPDPVPNPGFWWPKKLQKITAVKLFLYFWIENCNLLILRPPQRTQKLQEKPSALIREHPALQFFTFFYICGSFLPSWIRIRIRIQNSDPDPATQINADPCGSGSRSRSTTLLPPLGLFSDF